MQDFTKKLKALREDHKLTQSETANLLGMKQQSYQKIESGKASDIKISTLRNICESLEASADWLLGLKE